MPALAPPEHVVGLCLGCFGWLGGLAESTLLSLVLVVAIAVNVDAALASHAAFNQGD